MKKSKIILAIALAIAIIVTCICVPTFSWFTRPHSLSGDKMMLENKNAYTAYNGMNVTIATKSSDTGVANPDSYDTTCSDSASLSGSGISTYHRKYYCTTITNSSETDQNVSLYARTLSIPTESNNGTLALGVNGPTRSYRDYSELATPSTKTTRDSMRIYFEKDNSVTGWNGTEFYICWNESSDTSHATLGDKGQYGTYYKLTHVGGNNNPNQYYADIPKTATHAFFCVENWGTNNNGNPNWGQRSQELYNLAQDGQTQTSSKLFKITSSTNGSGNHLVHTPPDAVTGNCINHYYDTIFVATGNTFDARLNNTTNIPTRTGYTANYIGTLKYYSSDENVFEIVDQNGQKSATGGYVKAVGAGEATLYTKSTGGSYPDEQQVETTVKVTSAANYVFNDVPIVRNMKIPGTTTDNKNVVKVYWYVMNNSTSKNLTYTIDEVYVGL